MEQRRIRPPNGGRRGGPPPRSLPPQARRHQGGQGGSAPGTQRGVRPLSDARTGPAGGRLAGLRLTGLGGGVFCAAVMFLLGWLDEVLIGGSLTLYGVLFLPVCVLTALWLRGGDLLTAPVVAPIAFAVGLLPVADGGGGTAGRLMGLVTALATEAGWLYGGTLIAGVLALVRRALEVRARRRST
ncbi:DUF6542 domain-containing protein [Streptomyces bungoensis]|uniref:DUF6542 domain-containing protein n=1 Tax=Streptomyces bungoensis TaxID=285568 RepID=UPI000D14E208|nr:DUF6542 domain-containing protein [Streptomyces bungoensis]